MRWSACTGAGFSSPPPPLSPVGLPQMQSGNRNPAGRARSTEENRARAESREPGPAAQHRGLPRGRGEQALPGAQVSTRRARRPQPRRGARAARPPFPFPPLPFLLCLPFPPLGTRLGPRGRGRVSERPRPGPSAESLPSWAAKWTRGAAPPPSAARRRLPGQASPLFRLPSPQAPRGRGGGERRGERGGRGRARPGEASQPPSLGRRAPGPGTRCPPARERAVRPRRARPGSARRPPRSHPPARRTATRLGLDCCTFFFVRCHF